jgi:hypothetical protein
MGFLLSLAAFKMSGQTVGLLYAGGEDMGKGIMNLGCRWNSSPGFTIARIMIPPKR